MRGQKAQEVLLGTQCVLPRLGCGALTLFQSLLLSHMPLSPCRKLLDCTPSPVVFCHNDIQEGRRSQPVS